MREEIITALLATEHARFASGKSEVAVRCPFCGDSQKSTHPHMYVSVRYDVMQFDCKRCPASGVVTPYVLHRLGIHDSAFDEFLKVATKNSSRKIISFGENSHEYTRKLIIPRNVKDEKETARIAYVSERTSIDFSNYETLKSYRIVPNVTTFGKMNNIDLKNFGMFTENSIGFISYDWTSIQIRNLDQGLDKYVIRHFSQENRKPYVYIPPSQIDLLTDNPVISLSEGPFDSICTQYRFANQDEANSIFLATGTKGGFKNGLERALYLTGFFGARVRVFSDSDVDLHSYQSMFAPYRGAFHIEAWYNGDPNEKGKRDFGDVRERWDLRKHTIF